MYSILNVKIGESDRWFKQQLSQKTTGEANSIYYKYFGSNRSQIVNLYLCSICGIGEMFCGSLCRQPTKKPWENQIGSIQFRGTINDSGDKRATLAKNSEFRGSGNWDG